MFIIWLFTAQVYGSHGLAEMMEKVGVLYCFSLLACDLNFILFLFCSVLFSLVYRLIHGTGLCRDIFTEVQNIV